MPLLALLHVACLALMAALVIGAGVQDLRSMQIANGFSLAIAGLFVVWAAAGLAGGKMSFEDLALSLGCGVAVFGVGTVAFAFGALGGGDVKLLAAVSLFAGPQRLPDFLIITAVPERFGRGCAPACRTARRSPPAACGSPHRSD
jgi:prepilin peptidase CpaA